MRSPIDGLHPSVGAYQGSDYFLDSLNFCLIFAATCRMKKYLKLKKSENASEMINAINLENYRKDVCDLSLHFFLLAQQNY